MKRFFLVLFLVCFFWSSGTWAGEQLSYTTAQTIIDNSRTILAETTASHWVDTSMLIWVNMGVQDISSKTGCLDTSYTVVLTSGISEYAISSGTSFFGIKTALYQSGTSTFKGLSQGNPQSMGHVAPTIGEPVYWYKSGNNIGIYPYPASSGNTVYALLSRRPTSIGLTGTVPIPAIYDNTLTFWVIAMAFLEDKNNTFGKSFMDLYREDLKFYVPSYELWPFKKIEEIIK